MLILCRERHEFQLKMHHKAFGGRASLKSSYRSLNPLAEFIGGFRGIKGERGKEGSVGRKGKGRETQFL